MKPSILLIHNRYIHSGGEERYVSQLQGLLIEKGHQVATYETDNANFQDQSLFKKIWSGIQIPFSIEHYWGIRHSIKKNTPSVVHIHNVFPLLTPSVYFAASHERIPIVQSLHNYRFLCSNGLFLLPNGSICERCAKGSHLNGLRFRCYGGRLAGSAAMAVTLTIHRWMGTFKNKISAYIAPSKFLKQKYIEAGFPEERIHHLPSAIPDLAPRIHKKDKNTILFVGRLSREKGLFTLLKAARECPEWTFQLAGDGPRKAALESFTHSNGMTNVQFLGHQEYASIQVLLQKATFLILPSECFENLPMVILEAWFYGLPVIGSRLGGMAEAIENKVNGHTFEPGNVSELVELIKNLSFETSQKMQSEAMITFSKYHRINDYYDKLNMIYNTAF